METPIKEIRRRIRQDSPSDYKAILADADAEAESAAERAALIDEWCRDLWHDWIEDDKNTPRDDTPSLAAPWWHLR